MADILEKDFEVWDTSLAATNPFFLKPSEVSVDKYINGEDLERSIRITERLKDPIELRALSYNPESTGAQAGESAYTGITDTLSKIAPITKNWASQLGVQMFSGENVSKKYQDKMKEFGIDWGNDAELKGRQEMIDMLNGSVYPINKYFRRLLAKSTQDISERNILRELYQQSHGADSSKWYNQLPYLLGSTIAIPVPARGVGTIARLAGSTRYGAAKAAENVARGLVFAEEAGEFSAETAQEYLDRTGDRNFENFTPSDTAGLLASLNGYINQKIEFMGDMDLMLLGAIRKVGVRTPLGKAAARGALTEFLEEGAQGTSRAILKTIEGDEEPLTDKIKQAWVNAVWALPIGGTLAPVGYYVNRRNLVKGIKQAVPNITNTQAVQVADVMIDAAGETILPNQPLYNDLRKKVEYMYRDIDIDNKDDIIDATTELEYTLIAGDSLERGIDIADNPLFKGEVNELGWFREGIPENRRIEIQGYIDELNDLKKQLKTLNEAKEKDWEKIEEIENKLDKFNSYVLDKLSDLAHADANSVRRMLRGVEQQYVSKQKKKAGLPTGEEAVFKVFPDEKFNAEEKHIEPYEYTHADNKFRYKDDGMHHVIELLDSDNNVLSAIEINKSNSGVNSINTFEENNWRKGYGSTLLREAERLFGDNLTVSPESTEWAQGFWKRKNRYTEEIRPSVFRKARQPMFQDQFDLADENARLDDIYPEYTGETIEVDGKERTVYNSNGDRIAKSAEALRNFYKWFGDSKVVDEQGRPLVVYHGTYTDFDEFKRRIYPKFSSDSITGHRGHYFSTNKEVARSFSVGGHIVQAYLRIEDMSEIDALGKKWNNLQYLGIDIDEEVEKAYKSGKDGVLIKNIEEGYSNKVANDYVVFDSTQIKSVDNRGTYSSDTGNIYLQNRVSGAAPATYRGAYIPEYRFILRANKMDASTLSHELAHDWMETNFDRYRSGKQSKDFMKAWGALEKALGIPEDATSVPRQASETFARAYEAWIVQNADWTKFISVDDKDKDAVEKLMKDYQGELRDIYNDITSPYFKQTWGKLGELKPELKAWFDRVVNIRDLDVMVERGEMTEEQARNEKLNRAIDTVIENTKDEETKQALKEARTINDTARYEVEGGNKNSIQQRLSNLAREIDENNMLSKGQNYDTRRDMMQVAEAADNFVKTRLDDALAIINGEMAETEGLYKEDLYTALERLAVENGDLGLIDELKNSEISNRLAKELGQRVAGFRNFKQSTDLDVVSALKSLDNKFNKALDNKKAKKQFDEALKMLNDSIKQQDKLADKELDETLKQLECQ